MKTTFTYQVWIGNDYDIKTDSWTKQIWRQSDAVFHTKNEEYEIEEYEEALKEQIKLGNVKYVSKCIHD
jgi:hypothetical protein